MTDIPDAVVFDAFALATAARTDATLLVGADDDYDDVTEVVGPVLHDEGRAVHEAYWGSSG